MAGRLRQIGQGSDVILHCRSMLIRYKLEPEYSYRISNLFCRRVAGRAVRRVRSKKISGPAQVALFFSASLGLVRDRSCLLRHCFYLRLSNSRTPNDNTISKRGIDAPLHCGGFKCRLERVVLSGKKSQSHLPLFTGLFDRCYRVLVLRGPVRQPCGIGSRSLHGLPSLRECLGISSMAIKQQNAVKVF